jgi:hypothetical protein
MLIAGYFHPFSSHFEASVVGIDNGRGPAIWLLTPNGIFDFF